MKWLLTIQEPAARLARWLILLAQYDFTIVYKPGKQNANADALSRFVEENTQTDDEEEQEYIICATEIRKVAQRIIKPTTLYDINTITNITRI